MLGSKHFPHVPIFIEDFPICSHKKRAHFYGFLWFVPFVPIHFSTVNVTNWLHLMTAFLGAHHPHVPLLMLRVNLPFASRILPYVSMFPIYVAIFSYSFSYVFPYVPHMSTTSFQMNWWQEDEDLDLQPTLFQQWMGDLRGDESAMALIFWGFQCFPQDLPRIVSALLTWFQSCASGELTCTVSILRSETIGSETELCGGACIKERQGIWICLKLGTTTSLGVP